MGWLRRGDGEAEWLVVGLGNPGPEYASHRHNVGFWVINELARRAGVRLKAAGRHLNFAVAEIEGTRVALVKPRTFVNLSGIAVREALKRTGADLARTIVVHDDLDLPVGALRIRQGGGHGGHNGLKSIGAEVGLDFVRIRIGIGRPVVNGEPTWDPDVIASYVLSAPPPRERSMLEEAVRLAADAVPVIISEGVDQAATRFNRKPPQPSEVPGA